MALERRRLRGDPVGPDTAERLRPVVVHVEIEYRPERTSTRMRGGRQVVDDSHNLATRKYVLNLSSDALHPSEGPKMIATTLAQQLYKRLVFEGWPDQQRGTQVDVRPGDENYHG